MTSPPPCYVVRRCDGSLAVIQLASTAPLYLQAIAREVRVISLDTADRVIAGPVTPITMAEYRADIERERQEVAAWAEAERLNLRDAVREAVARYRARKALAPEALRAIAEHPDPRD